MNNKRDFIYTEDAIIPIDTIINITINNELITISTQTGDHWVTGGRKVYNVIGKQVSDAQWGER